MASDTEETITIQAFGGDQAAAEINKATMALDRTTTSSSQMESQFQHRFQHIGLMLFAGDAIRAAGLGRETRTVINTLNLALMEGASVAGISSGGILLLVTALAALAAIAVKVADHHKTMAEAMDKTIKSQQESYKQTLDGIEVIKQYNHVVGGSGGLLEAEKNLAALQSGQLIQSERAQIEAIKQQIQANIDHAKTMALIHQIMTDVAQAYKNAAQFLLNMIPGYSLLQNVVERLSGSMKNLISALHLSTGSISLSAKETQDLAMKNAALQAKLQGLIFEINHGGEAWKDYMKSADEAWNKVAEDIAKTQEDEDKWAKHFTGIVKQIGSDFGNAFAQMIVEGKDFTEEMEKAFTKMAEQIIAKIVEMIAEWAIFTALTGFGGGVGAFGAAGLKGIGFATGGSVMVDRPTLALFGEGGPEMATFTPMSQMGAGGAQGGGSGGGDIYVGAVNTSVSGVNNPDQIARVVGQKIIEQIRGQGQINFSRA